jgi:hypothetical protein
MYLSKPSLHAPVLRTQAQKDLVRDRLSALAKQRQQRPAPVAPMAAAAGGPISIPLDTVTSDGDFDTNINITYRNAAPNFSIPMLLDTGNSTLIVPDFSAIATLPDFCTNYKVLNYNATEPWGCPACIVSGPIVIPIDATTSYEIPNCVFYACTADNPDGVSGRTANFGAGCVTPWTAGDASAVQSPLSYRADYHFAEFVYVPAPALTDGGTPTVTEGSYLNLYAAMPATAGYQMFDIVKYSRWMALRPKSVSIGTTLTKWPGPLQTNPITMIDSGGGPVFLSDPNDRVWPATWPGATAVALPFWTPGSICCQSIDGDLTIVLQDDGGKNYSYSIERARLPPPAQGLTLVMCRTCNKMQSQEGMNIGGLSFLFNYVLIDYAAAQIGFKARLPNLV